MLSTDEPLEFGLPELPYGAVWLIGAYSGDPRHLSPLAAHALGTADAVIHDPRISEAILGLVKPASYREAAAPLGAIERVIKLAQDGWRVVHLVEGNAVERAIECAIGFAEHPTPFRVVPNPGEPRSSLVLVMATTQAVAAPEVEQHRPPLEFSMSGLAG
jgi:Tetrapyrrole (Corrin/Porphyrin) Methylases